MEEDIKAKIIDLFSTSVGVEEKDIDSSDELVRDMNLTSLEIADFLSVVENGFKLEIPREDSQKFATLDDIINYVQDRSIT